MLPILNRSTLLNCSHGSNPVKWYIHIVGKLVDQEGGETTTGNVLMLQREGRALTCAALFLNSVSPQTCVRDCNPWFVVRHSGPLVCKQDPSLAAQRPLRRFVIIRYRMMQYEIWRHASRTGPPICLIFTRLSGSVIEHPYGRL